MARGMCKGGPKAWIVKITGGPTSEHRTSSPWTAAINAVLVWAGKPERTGGLRRVKVVVTPKRHNDKLTYVYIVKAGFEAFWDADLRSVK